MHVAIIMDGNGRWATQRGLARLEGHKRGAANVRQILQMAPELGIKVLSLYAFSSDNWKRPGEEVSGLLQLFATFLEKEIEDCLRSGIRLRFLGRRDRLPASLLPLMESAEARSLRQDRLEVRIAVDYSSRAEMLSAFAECTSPEALAKRLGPEVDLLIRTGGEQRLSDFLLWQCSYAELYFTPVSWPDFTRDDFQAALDSFAARQRRFGSVPGCKIVMNEPSSTSYQ